MQERVKVSSIILNDLYLSLEITFVSFLGKDFLHATITCYARINDSFAKWTMWVWAKIYGKNSFISFYDSSMQNATIRIRNFPK